MSVNNETQCVPLVCLSSGFTTYAPSFNQVIISFSCSSDFFSFSYSSFSENFNVNNERNPPSCPFPVLMTPFSDIAFISKETLDCINKDTISAINEAAIGAIIAPTNPPYFFFISSFTVSVAPSINTPDFSNGSTILIISSIYLFEMNNVNLFPALTTSCTLIFLSILFNAEIAFVANLGNTSLAKGTARPNIAFLP